MASPRQTFAGLPATPDRDIDREVAAIEQAAAEPMSRGDIGRAVRARYWGPGRFRRALRVAQQERRIQRVGRDRYRRA